jgi:hypothetical protein
MTASLIRRIAKYSAITALGDMTGGERESMLFD